MTRALVKRYHKLMQPAFAAVVLFVLTEAAFAQPMLDVESPQQPVTRQQPVRLAQNEPQPEPAAGRVRFNLQGDIKLDVLLTYLSQRLERQFVIEADIANRSVTIRTPDEIPVSTLPILLSSVLRSENLALVESEQDGLARVVDVSEIGLYAPNATADEVLARQGAAAPVTQVFELTNLQPTDVQNVIRPLLTKNGSNIIAVPGTRLLVVTDYSITVKRIGELIGLVDKPPGDSAVQFYEAKNQPSATLVERVENVFGLASSKRSAETGQSKLVPLRLIDEPKTNRIIVAGLTRRVLEAVSLLQRLDTPTEVRTRAYRLRLLTATRLEKLISGYLSEKDRERVFQSTVDEEGNMLVVRATDAIHRQIEALIAELDQPSMASESPIRFYKLKNAQATDVLFSLLALQNAYGVSGGFGSPLISPLGGLGVSGSLINPVLNPGLGGLSPGLQGLGTNGLGTQPIGGGLTPAVPTTRLPIVPGQTNPLIDSPDTNTANPLNPSLTPGLGGLNAPAVGLGGGLGGLGGGFGGGLGQTASLPGGARVSADPSTNSIIIVAPANVQPMYARLIESLDQRKPQVLIEAKIVAVDTSDNYSLGVEVSFGDRSGVSRLFSFTSFGLSAVDPVSGALQINPALGFNGTLVDPDVADVVVQALATHTRARVLSAPKILVNDNAQGVLESTTNIPFASVNASDTVATTSLGGELEAGTTVLVVPRINEDNNLQLAFDIEFSTFTGTGTDTLPPSRQVDKVSSTVTIPSGQTVIVGGLKRVSDTSTFTGIPVLEHIPIIRELSSRTTDMKSTTSFFIFLRPVVLRDSLFRDLKFFSVQDQRPASIEGELPRSTPLLMR